MLKKVLSVIIAIVLGLSMILCCTVIIKSALGYDKSVLGYRVFYIVSGSMEPTIHTGAAVLVQKSDEYVLDDIITFESSDSAIYGYPNTHRIIDVAEENGKKVFTTKGDANPIADGYTVSEDAIYGKVVFHTGEMYWLGTLIGMMTTPLGFITVIILPILAIIAIMVHDFTKEYKAALVAEVESMRNANGMYASQDGAAIVNEQQEVPIVQSPLEQTEPEQTAAEMQEQIVTEEPTDEAKESVAEEQIEEDIPETEETEETVSETGEENDVSETEEIKETEATEATDIEEKKLSENSDEESLD